MNDQTDRQLLRDYAEHQSEAAFAELVRRHVDLVYSAAIRMVRDPHLAGDVTQAVFVALAQHARQLADHPVVSGWLHRTAQNTASKIIRTDVRRRAHEQEAAAMNELLSAEPDIVWQNIAPHLDAALGELSEPDRDAVLLRYFERKSAREMAQILGISDEAAQKRVARAVERLREFFTKRGVTVGAGGLVIVISANAVQAAPAGLAVTISTVAALAGTTIATTATATVTKTIAMTALQKTLILATITAAVGTGIYEARRASNLRDQVLSFQQQQTPIAAQIQQLTADRNEAARQLAALRSENEQLNRNSADLLKLRGEMTQLREASQELAKLKAVIDGDQTLSGAASWKARVSLLKQRLDQTPGAKIPELQFVTEKDWLNAAKGELETDADYRRALSTLRGAGEDKVAGMLKQALAAYIRNNNKQVPTDLVQLQPYFDKPLDDTILQRWEIAPAETIKSLGMGGDIIITQKSPVDDVFDMRIGIGPIGTGKTDFLSQEVAKTMDPVWEAFKAANNGEYPDDVSQLTPYAKTPEQLAALQKLLLSQNAVSK